jgi:ribosomal protein S18 acetylase RimI-like enzyme
LWRELTQYHRDIYGDPSIGGTDPGGAFDEHLANPRLAGVWVAEDDGQVVGFCGLLVEAEEAEADPIVVGSAQRSQGVGRRLLEHVTDEAKSRGVRFLSVRPVARNIEAFSLYYGAGFRTLGQVELFMELRQTGREWKPGIRIHEHDFEY